MHPPSLTGRAACSQPQHPRMGLIRLVYQQDQRHVLLPSLNVQVTFNLHASS